MNEPADSASEANPILDRVEALLWLGLLVFGSWVAITWMNAEPPPTPEALPRASAAPASSMPSDLINAEDLALREKTGAFEYSLSPIGSSDAGSWSRGGHMLARGMQDGDHVDLALPRRYPGDYGIEVFMSRAPEHGIVAFSLNGERIGQELDLYSERAMSPTGAVSLGIARLEGRGDVLRVEIVGVNAASEAGRRDLAIDGIRLQRLEAKD